MAIYNYDCEKCGQRFDVHKSMSKMSEDEVCECGGLAHHNSVGSMETMILGVPKAEEATFPYTGRRPPSR